MGHNEGADTSTTPGGWCAEFSSPDGLITLAVDEKAYDFHIDARPGHKPSAMRDVLLAARSRGLEVLDEDEMDPEILEDGSVRIYLAPIEQYAVVPVVPVETKRTGKRVAYGLALAASIATAFLVPSPFFDSPAPAAEQRPVHIEPFSSSVPAVSTSSSN